MPLVARMGLADYSLDHRAIVRISRQSPYTRGLSDVRYVQEYYVRGEMAKLEVRDGAGYSLVGFILIRNCKRAHWTSIYYAGIREDLRGRGLGKVLLRWVENQSPWTEVRLGVDEANEGGKRFWDRMGFLPAEPAFRVAKRGQRIYQFYKFIDRG